MPGLESYLRNEIRAVGGVRPHLVAGGVEFEANDHVLYRCLLEVGLGIDVRARMGDFHARYLDAIVSGVTRLPWGRFLGPGHTVEVRASSRRSRIVHTGAIEERVLLGLRKLLGVRPAAPSSEETSAGVSASKNVWRVYARMERDHLELSISLAGEALHRRGYRHAVAKAPLREDLARALLVLSGWRPDQPLVDPFCGSGTILIEAARLARRVPPGWGRTFAIETAPTFAEERWTSIRNRLEADIAPCGGILLFGSDRDAGAIEAARANAVRAGVEADIQWTHASIRRAPILDYPWETEGLWLSNPPYGDRAQGGRSLRALYQTIGQCFRTLPGEWRLGLFVDNPTLAHGTGIALKSQVLLDHGGKKVRLYLSS